MVSCSKKDFMWTTDGRKIFNWLSSLMFPNHFHVILGLFLYLNRSKILSCHSLTEGGGGGVGGLKKETSVMERGNCILFVKWICVKYGLGFSLLRKSKPYLVDALGLESKCYYS
jgi:hypothetical protein